MKIAVVPGDGIRKDVVPVAESVLRRLHRTEITIPRSQPRPRGAVCAALDSEEMQTHANAHAILFRAATSDTSYQSVLI